MPLSYCKRVFISLIAAALAAGSAKADGLTGTVLYDMSLPDGYGFDTGRPFGAAGGQVVITTFDSNVANSPFHAVLFSANQTVTDLNPSNFTLSEAEATDGIQQVGDGQTPATGGNQHALLWNGSAASAVDLNPSSLGVTNSFTNGVGGGQQVGYGYGSDEISHALLWTGTASSAVDLNPSNLGITYSFATATNGVQQVGYGSTEQDPNTNHALLWTGTANSAVDLTPSNLGITDCVASGVGGGQEVGDGDSASTGGNPHALVWNGTANSAVDLNPSSMDITSSFAIATNGSEQVGYGSGSGTGGSSNALLWTGTADSAVDLQSLLPSPGLFQNWIWSEALSVDASGDVFGIAESDSQFSITTNYYAVEWTAVPEPSSLTLLAIGCTYLLRRQSNLSDR
jgi:hypothetical protein